MYIYLLIFFLLLSCRYPDIDSVPEFDSLDISIDENIDLCKIKNKNNSIQDDCFKELNSSNGLYVMPIHAPLISTFTLLYNFSNLSI